MKVWVIRNKRKEFRYFQYYQPQFAGPDERLGHYVRTDTWPEDIDYYCQTHEWVPDEPIIPPGTWFVRLPSGEIDYGKRLSERYIPAIRRKIMNYKSNPIQIDL